MMVPPMEQYIELVSNSEGYSTAFFPGIPEIDMSEPDSKQLLVDACQDLGFFKVVNHSVPMEFISRLETEATKFFSLSFEEKERATPAAASRFGYTNRCIGANGDLGWLEYLLLNPKSSFSSVLGESLVGAVDDYVSSVKKMACEIVEKLADGLNIEKNTFSKLLMHEESDSVFRVNRYPPSPELEGEDWSYMGFGPHTDPQIISVLLSNNASGLQIELEDGWLRVPSDQSSFFVNVGDSMQVMTNGRFKSVKHRVVTGGLKSRVSMIYFGGPPLNEKIAPLPSVMAAGERSLYKEFTWSQYKSSAFQSRLADNRLAPFVAN